MMSRGGDGSARQGRIRPPRRIIRAPASNKADDPNESWNILKSALVDIHNKNCSALSYEQLYRASYKIVLDKKSQELYQNVKDFEEQWFAAHVIPEVRALIYARNTVNIALEATSVAQRRQAGEDFLRGLRDAWENHRVCMNMTADVLMYLERNWVSDANQPSIWMATIGLFRDHILKANLSPDGSSPTTVMDILNDVVYSQIQMEREGHVIDHNLIRSNMYMLEGLWETDSDEDETQKLYLTLFEPEFLARSRAFFQSECARLLREGDAITWIWQTRSRLNAEDERCATTLSPSTKAGIQRVVFDAMITEHAADFVTLESTGLRWMIDNNKWDDINMLYLLLSMVDMKAVLVKAVGLHIVHLGMQIEKQVLATLNAETADAAAAGGGSSTNTNTNTNTNAGTGDKTAPQTAAAIKWVEDVHALLEMFEQIWERCFVKDPLLQPAISKAFSSFIERFPRASEFVSLYVDDSLKKGIRGKTETEVDRLLSSAITVIRYLPDKDMFERYYQKHLARRLLYGKSESHDVEQEMIARMKQEMGNQFTSKFEGMFKDLATSLDLSTQYRDYVQQSSGGQQRIDLSVNILTLHCWPPEICRATERSACVYPPEIARLHESLTAFYLRSRSGRRLQWVDGNGNADIKCTFPAVAGSKPGGPLSKERRYEINVTTYGMVVLLLFNDVADGTTLTLEEIQQRTGIPARDLQRTLGVLSIPVKSRVLVKNPLTKSVQPGDRFGFNKEFVSKSVKIRAATSNSSSRVEDPAQRKDTEDSNVKTRAYIIDAAVVRIMKQRKKLTHTNLISEVVAQLAGRFKPDIALIKKRIEDLIARDYLDRMEGADPPAYSYIS